MQTRLTWWGLAALLLPCPLLAQSPGCPELPVGSGFHWESSVAPDFIYCKALRESDQSQAFAVTLRKDSNFRKRTSLREDKAVIDGHEVRWYRGDLAGATAELVLETEIELDDELYAHIFLRASSPEQRLESQRLAESIRFNDVRLLGQN